MADRAASIALAEAHARASRARHWPASAPCPAHTSGTCTRYLSDDGRTCITWVCSGCRRRLPACFGGADRTPDLCDDCATEATDAG